VTYILVPLRTEEDLWRGLGGSSFTGDPGRCVKKVSGCRHLSPWGPLPPKGTCFVGGFI